METQEGKERLKRWVFGRLPKNSLGRCTRDVAVHYQNLSTRRTRIQYIYSSTQNNTTEIKYVQSTGNIFHARNSFLDTSNIATVNRIIFRCSRFWTVQITSKDKGDEQSNVILQIEKKCQECTRDFVRFYDFLYTISGGHAQMTWQKCDTPWTNFLIKVHNCTWQSPYVVYNS